jgi:S1-C subfamily serine protease
MCGRSSSKTLAPAALAICLAWTAFAPGKAPARRPDVVRATVQIRSGDRRGSGTVIASSPDETWILTAAHVVSPPTATKVELHRFNLGYSGARDTGLTEGGGWPRLVSATVAAVDPGGDVAILLVRGMTALPFVARLDPDAAEPAPGETLTSVGIDRALHLTRWATTIKGWASIDVGRGGGPRRFTVITRPPEHGRSGGGLFRPDGTVVGVCTGRVEAHGAQRLGIFASVESIRRLLKDDGLAGALRSPASAP